ncbi:MAG: iron-containing alcohol dehydrogenase [Pelolinea sp.]|nr:iron-containing alcohol dehydrogenase [Pelolinea sp.]
MPEHMPIYIGDNAVEEFIKFCQKSNYQKYLLVADENTYRVLGKRVHEAMKKEGWDVIYIILHPEGLHADSVTLVRVLAVYDGQPRMFVAVGSGTITDTTRFTSHRSQNPFISLPTAASVDAYTSVNSAMTIGELKGSIYCQAPIAIFTDIPIIVESPKWLTASGFGDLTSKFTSSADWKNTHIIWGSKYDPEIYEKALGAAKQAAAVAEGIVTHDPKSMAAMMQGQFDSGFSMADFGNSAPASGGEHHIAHVWEMMFHWAGREGLYHGNAVGVATIIEAGWYERLRKLSKKDAEQLLACAQVPSRAEQEKTIRAELPEIAEVLIASNPIYMQLSDPQVLERVKKDILDNWDEIQAIAAKVPPPDQFRAWLKSLGGPTTTAELELSPQQAKTAIDHGHYLRERFSINNIRKLFGW